jgi:hypothetical protein
MASPEAPGMVWTVSGVLPARERPEPRPQRIKRCRSRVQRTPELQAWVVTSHPGDIGFPAHGPSELHPNEGPFDEAERRE